MMNRANVLRALTATAVAATTLCLVSSPAQAAVDDCHASRSGSNKAAAWCFAGFGRYRVAAKCDSPTYPYTTTIYGNWVSRKSDTPSPPFSRVSGDAYNCHIVKAWTDV